MEIDEDMDEDDEDEEPEYEGIGRDTLGMLDDEVEIAMGALKSQEEKTDFASLKAGISSLIQSSNLISQPEVEISKKPAHPKMPPTPTEARPLYEIVEEVKNKQGDSSDIFLSGHGYKLQSAGATGSQSVEAEINISKVVADGKTAAEKEEERKRKEKEKKDKYKVKF